MRDCVQNTPFKNFGFRSRKYRSRGFTKETRNAQQYYGSGGKDGTGKKANAIFWTM